MNEWEQGVEKRYDKEFTTVMEDKNIKTRHLLDDTKETNGYVRWRYHMIAARHSLHMLAEQSVQMRTTVSPGQQRRRREG